uniref:RING-type domain-containing protein n=1 Tax=Electrophorus electricus TaxID=8005 RepID=A0AAY5EUV0_ELEEL
MSPHLEESSSISVGVSREGYSDSYVSVVCILSGCGVCEQVLTDPVSITCGHRFCRQCISSYWDQSAPSRDFSCPQCRKRFRTRPVLHPHKDMEVSIQQDSRTPVDDVLHTHKTCMKNKYESLFEGTKSQENKTLLNRVYTQLYIIDGESEGVNEEHEVLQMEKTLRKQLVQDTPIYCSDIFKPVQELKTVLTKGIAGIGKTVSVQKFILDWAEGKANQDVDFMFVLPFRELNLVKDDQYSLHRLLCDFHPEIKDLDPKIYDVCKFVFIFDGLDESRIQLNFSQCNKVSEISMTSSVGVLTSNLIKGELLPSALIWITSRPAAANQIPPHYINRVTEIQGFTDPQKEEYFRKRISDQDQAEKIISHIKTAKSLHIMCHIPVFCWISATVLQEILKQTDTEIPKTLTEMYIQFLLSQKQNVSPERFINLTHCLIEMKDTSLHENIQKFLKEESSRKLTLAQCSALAFQLQMSEEVLDELSLKKYKTTLNGFWRLLPAVSNCRRALLAHCNLTAETCKMISSVLQTANCPLRELDLSRNELKDSGVEHLSAGLNSSHCKVEILGLAHCNLTAETCKMISSVLQTANLPLRELDLSHNELQDSGVEHLSAGLNSSHCKVEILR